jgi:PilZ domain
MDYTFQARTSPAEQNGSGRRWNRYPISLSLRVRVPTPSGGEFMLAHGRDVSQGGMAVYVPVELEIGSTVLLELVFPELKEPIGLSASIRNRIGFKYGVEFENPTDEQREVILQNLRLTAEADARRALHL